MDPEGANIGILNDFLGRDLWIRNENELILIGVAPAGSLGLKLFIFQTSEFRDIQDSDMFHAK